MRIIVTTDDARCEVVWDGRPVLTASSLAPAIEAFLQAERDFPVGDIPEPGCTAGYSVERRVPASEFEMAVALQNFPRETGIAAIVETLQGPPAREGFSLDKEGRISDAGFWAGMGIE